MAGVHSLQWGPLAAPRGKLQPPLELQETTGYLRHTLRAHGVLLLLLLVEHQPEFAEIRQADTVEHAITSRCMQEATECCRMLFRRLVLLKAQEYRFPQLYD